MNHAEVIDQYLAGPKQLRDAIDGMIAEQIDAAPLPGKWSTRQVICHIADFEPVYADHSEAGPLTVEQLLTNIRLADLAVTGPLAVNRRNDLDSSS